VRHALLLLLLAAPLRAADPVTVFGLKERYVSAIERADKLAALERLAVTAPRDLGDISALYDLFMRFPEPSARRASLASLQLAPVHPTLEPLTLTALRAAEPESVYFGAHLAAKTGTPAALEELRKVAARPLRAPAAQDVSMATERGTWWAQYEALDVLASVDGEKALPLIKTRMAESPAVGAIAGRRLWKPALPELLRLAASSKDRERAAAREAARQPIDPADARATRAQLLAAIPDAKLDAEFRHQLALKAGASSDEGEAEELARRHGAAKSEGERLLWASALFASQKPAAIPLLAEFAKNDPDELRRLGARTQLVRMLGEEKTAALLGDVKDVKK
jgi:hypothetical protein